MLRPDRIPDTCLARNHKQRRMTEQDRRWLSDRVAGVILAGGQNSRMGGRDKAFLRVNGETVFSRTLSLMRGCFPEVLVVSNAPEKYAGYNVDVTADELPGLGPLGGLHAALGRVEKPYAFVVACDMPFLRIEPIRFLTARIGDADAVVPRWGGDVEPLHAVYAQTLRPRIATAIAGGARAIRDLLPLIRVDYVAEAELAGVSGAEESFRNVNTPEEAARFAVQVGG
jgi:molybdenum cofactor guanylyltransferase